MMWCKCCSHGDDKDRPETMGRATSGSVHDCAAKTDGHHDPKNRIRPEKSKERG